MKLKITTTIEVDENITDDDIQFVRENFENLAYKHNMCGDPKVKIEELN